MKLAPRMQMSAGYSIQQLWAADVHRAPLEIAARLQVYLAPIPEGSSLWHQVMFYELHGPDTGVVAVLGVVAADRTWPGHHHHGDQGLALGSLDGADPFLEHQGAIKEMGRMLHFNLSPQNAAPDWKRWEEGLRGILYADRLPRPQLLAPGPSVGRPVTFKEASAAL